jgi:hypothetical protein
MPRPAFSAAGALGQTFRVDLSKRSRPKNSTTRPESREPPCAPVPRPLRSEPGHFTQAPARSTDGPSETARGRLSLAPTATVHYRRKFGGR